MAQRYATIAMPWRLDRLRIGWRVGNVPLLAGLALAVVALLSLLYLAATSGVAITGYDVQQLEAQRADWQRRNDQLRLQIAEARSLDRVEREARRLGMAPPERALFVARPALQPTPAPTPTGGMAGFLEVVRGKVVGILGWLSDGS